MSNIARNGARGKLAVQLTALVVSRGVLLGATVAVARAAGVSDYGTFALALVIFQAGLLLRDAGLGQALIILGGDSHGLTWRAFIGISCVGALLALAMGIFAGPITNALGLPDSAAYS